MTEDYRLAALAEANDATGAARDAYARAKTIKARREAEADIEFWTSRKAALIPPSLEPMTTHQPTTDAPPITGGDVASLAAMARQSHDRASLARVDMLTHARARNAAVDALRAAGWTYRQVANALGVTERRATRLGTAASRVGRQKASGSS